MIKLTVVFLHSIVLMFGIFIASETEAKATPEKYRAAFFNSESRLNDFCSTHQCSSRHTAFNNMSSSIVYVVNYKVASAYYDEIVQAGQNLNIDTVIFKCITHNIVCLRVEKMSSNRFRFYFIEMATTDPAPKPIKPGEERDA